MGDILLVIIMGLFTVINAIVTVWGLTHCNKRELNYQKQLYEQIQMLQEQRLLEQKQLNQERSDAHRKQLSDLSLLIKDINTQTLGFRNVLLELTMHIEDVREQLRIRSNDDDRFATQKFPSVKTE